MNIPPEFHNFFAISFQSLNLFSFVLGAMWGLSTGWFRYKNWWAIVAYFAIVAIFYANSEAIETSIENYQPTPQKDFSDIDRRELNSPRLN